MSGGAGNDSLIGGAGNDTLFPSAPPARACVRRGAPVAAGRARGGGGI